MGVVKSLLALACARLPAEEGALDNLNVTVFRHHYFVRLGYDVRWFVCFAPVTDVLTLTIRMVAANP